MTFYRCSWCGGWGKADPLICLLPPEGARSWSGECVAWPFGSCGRRMLGRHRTSWFLSRHCNFAFFNFCLQDGINLILGRMATVCERLWSFLPGRVIIKELNDKGLLVVEHFLGITSNLALEFGLLCYMLIATCLFLWLRCYLVLWVTLGSIFMSVT